MYSDFNDVSSPQTQTFAHTAHAQTLKAFTQTPEFEALTQDITACLQDERQIPFCQEHRAKMYHFHQNADHPKGMYRVCSAASYRAGAPDWRILFYVADFDEILNDDVYLDGVSHYVEQPERVLLSLSVAGGDAAYTLEFDLNTATLVENGFHFPAAKNHIAWRDENSVWVCPAWDERQLSTSGYPREVWLWQRGQRFEEAQAIFQMDKNGVLVHAWRYLDGQGAPIDLLEAATGFFSKDYYQIDAHGDVLPLNLPKDAEIVGYLAGQLLVHIKSDWQRANQSYLAGSLLAVKLNKGNIGSAHVLFVPNEQQALESVETTKRFVVASILDQVSGKLKAWKWQNNRWEAQTMPDLLGGAIEITDQPWGGDTVYFATSGFLQPLTLFALDLQVQELSLLRKQPKQFNEQGMTVHQHFAHSQDGTAIPYYWVGSRTSTDTPTIVYAYGGFGVPELPHYLGNIGRHWLAKGYAFVLANIRGGGEFPHWHAAAQREHKHKSVDDLLAVVHDLHQRAYTSPARTALQGGSNGGLIVASAFVREPHRIGALVCEVPLTDMLDYADLSAGSSWLEEYGDPHNPQMRPYLENFSPFHQLDIQQNYPPSLITTRLSDDRVHPAHALKFYAKLRQNPHNATWLYAPHQGGHTGASTQADTAHELACILTFLQQNIGLGL